jgi:hypothetical protein
MNWSETSITQYTVNGLIWIYELQWGQHHTNYRRKRKWIYELEWNKHHPVYRKRADKGNSKITELRTKGKSKLISI